MGENKREVTRKEGGMRWLLGSSPAVVGWRSSRARRWWSSGCDVVVEWSPNHRRRKKTEKLKIMFLIDFGFLNFCC